MSLADLWNPPVPARLTPTRVVVHLGDDADVRRQEQVASAARARAAKTPLTPERRREQVLRAKKRYRDKQRALKEGRAWNN